MIVRVLYFVLKIQLMYKNKTMLLATLLVLAISIPAAVATTSNEVPFVIATPNSITSGDDLTISGQFEFNELYAGVGIKILDPNNELVYAHVVFLKDDGTFSYEILETNFETEGTYIVTAQNHGIQKSTSFNYSDNIPE